MGGSLWYPLSFRKRSEANNSGKVTDKKILEITGKRENKIKYHFICIYIYHTNSSQTSFQILDAVLSFHRRCETELKKKNTCKKESVIQMNDSFSTTD